MKSIVAPAKQSPEVYDSFFELFVYESIETLVGRSSGGNEVYSEIEGVGKNLGRKIIDLLSRDIQYKF